ncbi:MAG TPA: phosphatidylserine decarboxylase, partial [Planctomycetota bacterium]|nr:phosphatidylserine decarboxylase [Planctomycetota bacterium]
MRDARADSLLVTAIPRTASGGALTAFRLIPRVLASRVLGLVERVPLPRALRPRVYGAYARRYGVNLDEAERPIDGYRSLNAFFVRRLKAGARPIDTRPNAVVSPVDGTIASFGPIQKGQLFQAKGFDYSLEELVAVPPLTSGLLQG